MSSSTAASHARWEQVVERLVAERGDALTRYAYFVSGSQDDAADLVQDALVKTFGRLRNGFSVASAEAYVRRAILNTYLDRGRRTSRWRKIAHLETVTEIAPATSDGSDLALDLHEELRKLSPRERACLVLRYYEDMKVDDIAATLELSSGTVKRYLSDGLSKMATRLSEDALDEEISTDSHTTTDTTGVRNAS
ncbi:sigma-70 family RNA polymerase sigma factor [Glaciihabitans sp. dw_435]|uniref:sigma-70 family RNA polymerase sigma factor n=1 Tax=Glaciihabitans sp. dw_435 TaxID=2720081 RepID=UPI001BD1C0AB|nr:sigma-70 family RNA polymerase sigma factor [Glaciihabitans sp. dw_435]